MAFWRPGTRAPGEGAVVDRQSEHEGGEIAVYNPNDRLSISQQRSNLPIYRHRMVLMMLMLFVVVLMVLVSHCRVGFVVSR
jgi:hypothetical protein